MILMISSRLALAVVLSVGLSLPAASERLVSDETFMSPLGAFPDAVGSRQPISPAPGSKNSRVAEASKYKNTFNCIPESCLADARTKTPSPGALAGKQKKLGAALLVPAVQGSVRAPPRKPASPKSASPKPDTSQDDCMACD